MKELKVVDEQLEDRQEVIDLDEELLEKDTGTYIADARNVGEKIEAEELEIPVPDDIRHDQYDLITVYRVSNSRDWQEERETFRQYLAENFGDEKFLSLGDSDEFISAISRDGTTYMRACYLE